MHIHLTDDEHDDAFRQALARSGALDPREPTADLVAGALRRLPHTSPRVAARRAECDRRSGERQPLQQWHCWSFPPLSAHLT